MIPFIKNLTLRSQYILAENVVRKISHPDEIILNKGESTKCMILKKGLLGMVLNVGRSGKKQICRIIQTLQVLSN